MFGFAKSDRANLNAEELVQFKKAAKEMLAFSKDEMDALVEIGRLTEINHGDEDI